MKQRIDGTEKSDSLMRKTLTEHEKKLKQLKHGNNSSLSEIPPGKIEEISDGMKQFRKDFDDHKHFVDKEISTMNLLLPKKANLSDI